MILCRFLGVEHFLVDDALSSIPDDSKGHIRSSLRAARHGMPVGTESHTMRRSWNGRTEVGAIQP